MAPRMILTPVLSVLALLATPALASATTEVHVEAVPGVGNVVVVTDDNSAGVVEIRQGVDGSTPFVAVQNTAGVTAGTGCIIADPPANTIVGCAGSFGAIVGFGNGGNDKVTMPIVTDNVPPLTARLVGGEGNDELRRQPDGRVGISHPQTLLEGEGGNDTLVTGNGADELHGGDGNDTLQAHKGPDLVYGEGGDDSVSGGKEDPEETQATDTVDGGPGADSIPDLVSDYERGFNANVTVTVNGQADDGEPGENDNVISVEKFRVRGNIATVVGSDAADDIFIEADRSNTRGLGGNDRLIAYDGHDTIDGGDGDDYLEGGFGNDVLTGGAGVDQFSGDRTESNVIAIGSDQIFARDGNAEQVSCGIGSDTAQVDGSDVVDSSCESVDRGPFGGGGVFGTKTLVTLKLAAPRIPARGPLPVRIANANDFAVTGSASGQTTNPVATARRRVKLKAKRFSVAANSRKTVKLKLPAPLQRVLRSTGKLSLRLTVKVKDPAGNTRAVKKKVTARLKR